MIEFKIIFDEYDKKFILLDDVQPGDIVLVNKKSGKVSPLFKLDNIEVTSLNSIKFNGEDINIEDVELKPMSFVADEYLKAESVYLKSVEECLPSPDDYTGIHKAAINAMKRTTPLALTKTQHNRKLSLVRELEKVGSGEKSAMSIQRLEELLNYYGLHVSDLIKTDLL